MKRRILSLLCAVATVLGMVVVPAYAAESTTTDMGNTHVTKLTENAVDLTLEGDTYIDLNGHSIAGVTVTDGTLYISDSQTDDYTVADGIYGSVTGITGDVQAAEGYVAITEGASVSYHKVDLTLKSMTLRPAEAGVYYNSAFAADEVVAANVESYGVALSVVAEPNAENLNKLCGYSTIYGFEAGEKSGTLLTGIMTESNTDYANNRNAAMAIYGRAYIKTADGYTFGACASRDLKTQVEAIDAVFASLNENQKAAILAMYKAFEGVIANWNVPNMKHAAAQLPQGDTVIKIPVEQEDGVVSDEITVELDGVSVTVPVGALVNMDELTLKVTRLDASESDIEAGEGQTLMPFDVHVEGIEADNTQPLTVALGKVMPENLNMGNYSIYHVEETGTNAMELVANDETFTAHNQYKYTLDGELTLHMATFSEVAAVTENENAWKGEAATEFAGGTGTEADPYLIRNADQLAYLNKLISADNEAYNTKNYKLLSDLNFKGSTWYPIGYWAPGEGNNAAGESEWYTYGGAFMGTFDGNGHTVSNISQNTWALNGNYDNGYWDEAMGLFGYVYGGTVKNLTVKNFYSEGEFTPTGCVTAYACNSTFENIALVNCNPGVYNTGNGGIVGIGGNSTDTEDYKITFNNITIDNSNKITALWGSWDVACGGLIGMFRGAGHVDMKNCHVAAQIDVYNDVCGNYQYYWYRYSGMLIGTNKNMITDANGYTVPETEKFHAENCTVHFGDWNDYYYCELVANSLASYTHDHQFSRLTQIASIDEIKSGDTWTKTGNYLLIDGDTKTCYHIRKDAEGNFYQHDHDDYNRDGIDDYETVNGQEILVENNRCIYLPFNQLFTGYGWGVKHIPIYDDGTPNPFSGVTILDRVVADSVEKFDKADNVKESYTTDTTITIGELFKAADIEDEKLTIQGDKVQVTVSPVDQVIDGETITSTAGATYTANATDWTNGTLTFSGIGAATITITDYYFCTPTTITVTIKEREAEVKFETLFTGDFLYRVGNDSSTQVQLSSLFEVAENAEITGEVSVTVKSISDDTDLKDISVQADKWKNSKLDLTDYTGVIELTITDNDYCIPTVLYLEVVEAKNTTTAAPATANNVVLLNDCGLGGITISNGYTFYGNGFTMSRTDDEYALSRDYAWIMMEGGTLDNVQIVAPVMNYSVLYDSNKKDSGNQSFTDGNGTTRYYNIKSAISAKGDNTILNSYVSGGRAGIYVYGGTTLIENTRVVGGAAANVHVRGAQGVTLRDITLIQKPMKTTKSGYSNSVMGFSVVSECDTNKVGSPIYIEGTIRQYAWAHAGYSQYVPEAGQSMISSVLSKERFLHEISYSDGTVAKSVNLGIVSISESLSVDENNIKDNRTAAEKEKLTYDFEYMTGADIYSITSFGTDDAKDWVCEEIEDYIPTDTVLYMPQFKYTTDLGGQYIPKSEDCEEFCYREGDTLMLMFPSGDTKELDLAAMVNIEKYTGQDLNLTITCMDSGGNAIAVNNGKVVLSAAGEYTVTYMVTDAQIYDKDGKKVDDSRNYSWNMTVSASLKDTAVPNAYFEFDTSKQKMGYYKPSWGDVKQFLPFLAGLKIYDYNGQTAYLRFDGDNDFNKVASITITEYVSNEAYLEIKLTDGGVINTKFLARADSGGASTYTGKIKTTGNTIYFVNDGGTSNKDTTTTAAYWYVDYYKFTGNNGTPIQSAQQTFNSTGSSQSTPSGNFSTSIKYTVTYDANEGTCGQTVGYATSVSAAVTLPQATRSGYRLAGWYTAASGGTRVGGAGDSYTPSSNITLYAQWGKPCTVTYNANGGVCGTTSEKYTGTALTLPTPTREGYWFVGWYDAPEGGNKIGDAGMTYNPAGEITLYAHWQERVEYTVTYNANEGTCGTASATYQGTALTLPTPSRTGYTFNGWYTAASGGTKIGDAGAGYIPSANITLYAQWTVNSYKITVTTSNATVSGVTNGQMVEYGTSVTITVKFNESDNQSVTVDGTNVTLTDGKYTFTMPAKNITINATSSSCVATGTLITLADGSQVPVEDLTGEEMLLVWNLETGRYEAAPIVFVDSDAQTEYEVISLVFSDGTDVEIIYEHGFFDVTTGEYVYLDAYNAADYIGHSFIKQGDLARNTWETVELVDVVIETKVTTAYSPVTFGQLCYYVDGMLSMPGGIAGLFNIFEVDVDTMTYNAEMMAADIETYGLFTYEDFAAMIPEEAFYAFNGAWLKVAMGKGMLTWEDIEYMANRYVPLM